mgnify:CR=1 FL=1
MSRKSYLFTSESVSEGHPDKVSDRISDEVVDAFYRESAVAKLDPWAVRAACETLCTTNRVIIAGEYSNTPKSVTVAMIQDLARKAIKDIGYEQKGFHWEKARYANYLHGQSAHIAQGVDASAKKDEGAGDQGIMFGYACSETPELMPATLQYSHNILKRLADVRHSGERPELEPDAKSQVTLRYENGKPAEVIAVVVSHQHKKKLNGNNYSTKRMEELVKPYALSVFPDGLVTKKTKWMINPTGRFEIGGPDGDSGLTGRKIIVDTYGGYAPHGGGAFSGKDPTKVDRSAAYAARYLAKNVVAAGLAERCMIQVAYAIGRPEPMSLLVDTQGTGNLGPDGDARLEKVLGDLFPLRPTNIRRTLQLNKPIYQRTAAYGHFGRAPTADGGFSWEKTDKADELKGLLK